MDNERYGALFSSHDRFIRAPRHSKHAFITVIRGIQSQIGATFEGCWAGSTFLYRTLTAFLLPILLSPAEVRFDREKNASGVHK